MLYPERMVYCSCWLLMLPLKWISACGRSGRLLVQTNAVQKAQRGRPNAAPRMHGILILLMVGDIL